MGSLGESHVPRVPHAACSMSCPTHPQHHWATLKITICHSFASASPCPRNAVRKRGEGSAGGVVELARSCFLGITPPDLSPSIVPPHPDPSSSPS
eukprot:828497-Pyramimonas_sp.AAC.1